MGQIMVQGFGNSSRIYVAVHARNNRRRSYKSACAIASKIFWTLLFLVDGVILLAMVNYSVQNWLIDTIYSVLLKLGV